MPEHNVQLSDQVVVLGTMHGKEQVIGPILTQELGVEVIVPIDFNTDQWGTFTREMDRWADQRTTARVKAKQAMEILHRLVGVASEGSFGPHPTFPWLAVNRELVVLVDAKLGLEVVGEVVTTKTNYRQTQVSHITEALEFARQVGFPSHGLVVMASETIPTHPLIFKGILTEVQLKTAMEQVLAHYPHSRVQLETDMRAMMNPTRMEAIAQATHEVVRKLCQTCPLCNYPGFERVEQQSGLNCGQCNQPTPLIRLDIYQCQHCGHRHNHLFPQGKLADPMYCSYCNP